MAINHLAPPTGNIADNVVGFARALRAAGLPVGPGAVIDAMNALQLIEIGNRADVFTTLESIFVKRHEHALIFKQAFNLFFRAAEEWKHMLDSVPLPDHARKKPPPASRRVQEAMSQPSHARGAAGPGAGSAAVGLRQGDPAEEGLRADERGRDRRGDARDREDAAAAGRAARPAATSRMRAGLRLDMRRTLRGSLAHRRRDHRHPQARADREAGADRGAARYLRLDERVYPPVPAFPACHHRRPQARLGVPVRHAADQCDARVAAARSRRGAGELLGDASRTGPAARGSRPRCTASTNCGRGGCWGRAPSCS